MCSGIAFLFGLFILFRGEFRINNRVVPRDQARLLGVLLMLPLLIGLFSASSLITPTGELDFEALQRSALLELGSLVIALGLAAYLVYSLPPSDSVTPRQPRSVVPPNPFAPPSAPASKPLGSIVTVPEAAAYLGISEAEVLHLIETSQLGAARAGSSYRIARVALDDFKQRNQS
jgi:excisionase family DNA binding protein